RGVELLAGGDRLAADVEAADRIVVPLREHELAVRVGLDDPRAGPDQLLLAAEGAVRGGHGEALDGGRLLRIEARERAGAPGVRDPQPRVAPPADRAGP